MMDQARSEPDQRVTQCSGTQLLCMTVYKFSNKKKTVGSKLGYRGTSLTLSTAYEAAAAYAHVMAPQGEGQEKEVSSPPTPRPEADPATERLSFPFLAVGKRNAGGL